MFPATPASACLHRLVAMLGIALVLALNVLAVWPAGHAWLHAVEKATACTHGHAHDPAPAGGDAARDDCAIATFAQGHAGLALAPQFIFAPRAACVATLAAAPAFVAVSRAHLLPPGCGPPAV